MALAKIYGYTFFSGRIPYSYQQTTAIIKHQSIEIFKILFNMQQEDYNYFCRF